MTTFNTIRQSINNEIDIMVVDDLVKSGMSKDAAVKLVTEYEFDIVADALANPAEYNSEF